MAGNRSICVQRRKALSSQCKAMDAGLYLRRGSTVISSTALNTVKPMQAINVGLYILCLASMADTQQPST